MGKVVLLFLLISIMPHIANAASESNHPEVLAENPTAVILMMDSSSADSEDVNPEAGKFHGYSSNELKEINVTGILTQGKMHSEIESAFAQQKALHNKMTIFVMLGILILSLVTTILYMSHSKKKEREIKLRFQGLFTHMREGFALHEIICNENGVPEDYRFLEVNQAFETITGLNAQVLKNKTVKEVLPDTEQYWIERYGEVALKNKTISFENYSGALGKHFNVSVYSPRPNQFATIFSDITETVCSKERVESERKLLEIVLADALLGYWDWDMVNDEQYLSPSFKEMLGYADHELENKPDTWETLIFQEDRASRVDACQAHVDSHGKIAFYNETRYHHKNGSVVWVISSGRVIEWDKDKPVRMVGCHIDVTNMKTLGEQLKDERNLFKTTLHSLGDGVISADKTGKVDLMNAVAEKLTGWTNVEAKGMAFETVFSIINELTRETCENPIEKVLDSGEIIELANHTMLIKKNGDEIPIEDSAAPIKDEDGNVSGVVLVFRDYTEKKEKQEKIKYLSHHDQLTGLYNRNFFEEELAKLDKEENLPFTIAMADVNGLKLTNDAFGHAAGDELLKKVAQILRRECRATDIVARVGGDEFVLLLPGRSRRSAGKIVDRIYKAVALEKHNNIIISVSIGCDTKVRSDQMIGEVFARAEEHMYRNKLIESQSMRSQTIKVIMKTLSETNPREKVHSEKVSQLSRKIGEAMNLSSETLKEIEIAALMHDIGKIVLNEELLNKPSKLTKKEYEQVKRHTEVGYQILKSVDIYSNLADCVLSHHEHWDGTGYPRGLLGERIPLIARIIAVADSFEAMTGERPYRKILSNDLAMKEIEQCSGTQFDPKIVEAFKKCHTSMELVSV